MFPSLKKRRATPTATRKTPPSSSGACSMQNGPVHTSCCPTLAFPRMPSSIAICHTINICMWQHTGGRLWKFLYSLSGKDIRKFLEYVTGSDRVPIKVCARVVSVLCSCHWTVLHKPPDLRYPDADPPLSLFPRASATLASLSNATRGTRSACRRPSRVLAGYSFRTTQQKKNFGRKCCALWRTARDSVWHRGIVHRGPPNLLR